MVCDNGGRLTAFGPLARPLVVGRLGATDALATTKYESVRDGRGGKCRCYKPSSVSIVGGSITAALRPPPRLFFAAGTAGFAAGTAGFSGTGGSDGGRGAMLGRSEAVDADRVRFFAFLKKRVNYWHNARQRSTHISSSPRFLFFLLSFISGGGRVTSGGTPSTAAASAAVASMISFKLSSKAASLLFMVFLRFEGCFRRYEGECERETRGLVEGSLCELAELCLGRFANLLHRIRF